MNKQQIVVWDPEDRYWEGSLVEPQVATAIRQRGGASLPVDASMFALSGIGGYMRRGWGAGWPLDNLAPQSVCPLALYVTPDHRVIHWVARLVPSEALAARSREQAPDAPGSIQLMSVAARANTMKLGLSSRTELRRTRDLGPTDSHGGWLVRGEVSVNPTSEGVASFSLYGTAPGLRVAWAAVSATRG